jgi:NAD(P)-dependent dehydrogenase (short-subunit alcohol dehydrogenase family)
MAAPILSLEGRSALVTGGGTGIGLGTAAALASAGAIVTICGPDSQILHTAAHSLEDSGLPEIRTIQADVTVEDQVAAAVEQAAVDGRLDIAVANAGTGFPGSILHLSADHWMLPLGVNVMGSAFTIKHAALNMKDHGGSIITMSSIASTRQSRFMAAYGVSKAALDELTRVAASELGCFGIRVNGIRPGWVETESLRATYTEENLERARRGTPLGRLGMPADIARAVLYFASDQSEWVTGQLLGVCGGFTLNPPSVDMTHLARLAFGSEMERDFPARTETHTANPSGT